MTPPEPEHSIQKLHDTEEIQTSFLYVLFISSVAAIGGFLFGFAWRHCTEQKKTDKFIVV